MLPMSSPQVNPGATETQQMRVVAPVGVSMIPFLCSVPKVSHCSQAQVRLRLRISFTIGGQTVQDQVDFSGFPQDLTAGST